MERSDAKVRHMIAFHAWRSRRHQRESAAKGDYFHTGIVLGVAIGGAATYRTLRQVLRLNSLMRGEG